MEKHRIVFLDLGHTKVNLKDTARVLEKRVSVAFRYPGT
jgi:hypothetical protein